jgi:endoglucanase
VNRREFLQAAGAIAAAAIAAPVPAFGVADIVAVSARHLPRWRGFNLLQKFTKHPKGNPPFSEADFAIIADWGFDFARLPLSYLCWTDPEDWLKLREPELRHLDEAVALGARHKVHVNLNLHRAPGYCVNPPKEPLDLWTDEKALEACAFHWSHLAGRYKGIPNERLSFDLLNEPGQIPEDAYVRVVKRLVQAIRAQDPQRLVIADGLRWGRDPVYGLVDVGIAQSTRGYDPVQISHYRASWMHGSDKWPEPAWPLDLGRKGTTNKETLAKEGIQPWKRLEQKGVGIHVGEWGAFNRTPHRVVLPWMRDCLALWKEAGWGWALWNLNGSFGVLDSQRTDVEYESFRGHKLDRQMLELLQQG